MISLNHHHLNAGYGRSGNFMSKIFITGSADGLGLMEARMLVSQGHEVVLHGRSQKRANEALSKVPGALAAVAADLASIAEIKSLADQVNDLGLFDAVIHNAGVYGDAHCRRTVDGLPEIFVVNSLAPYILTCLIKKPRRLVYTSSGLHRGGDGTLKDVARSSRRCSGSSAYADSKLQIVMLLLLSAENGLMYCPMQWIPAGRRRRWEGWVHPSASRRGRGRRCGWRSARTRRPWSREHTSLIYNPRTFTRLPLIRLYRKSILQNAAGCRVLYFPPDEVGCF